HTLAENYRRHGSHATLDRREITGRMILSSLGRFIIQTPNVRRLPALLPFNTVNLTFSPSFRLPDPFLFSSEELTKMSSPVRLLFGELLHKGGPILDSVAFNAKQIHMGCRTEQPALKILAESVVNRKRDDE